MYVTLDVAEWTDKHPIGTLNRTIGAIDVIDHYYEYQLYCKSLNVSISRFQKVAGAAISAATKTKRLDGLDDILKSAMAGSRGIPEIDDRTDPAKWTIFTIDPDNSLDFDDGFSIKSIECDCLDKQPPQMLLSIYITNVAIWLDVLQLWSSMSDRISTIYLPDKKRPMLPTTLSEFLCSLVENTNRVALVLDITLENGKIVKTEHKNALINVRKNYRYESPDLIEFAEYKSLLGATRLLARSHQLNYISNIKNSHDVVCYLMILMNNITSKRLDEVKVGVFRATEQRFGDSVVPGENGETNVHVPADVKKYMQMWNNSSGVYVDRAKVTNTMMLRHSMLNVDTYVHITSPLRRIVDLMNLIQLQRLLGLARLSDASLEFYDKWVAEIDYINTTMRSTRKLQCDCDLLDKCTTNPETMDKIYDGYMFDRVVKNDGLVQYIVFLPELKMSARIITQETYPNNTCKKFKLYMFNNEAKFKKKIRIQIQ